MKATAKKPLSLRQPHTEFHKTALAIGMSTLMLGAAASAADDVINLDKLSIEDRVIETNPYAEPGASYKARISADERHKKPLAEIPSTIQVITKAQIDDSGVTDLKEILDAQPGITLGTGENGNAFGDRYIIRGQEARSDVFVDGLRDPGMSIRESFATEQVEISKGPNSSFAGRGTAGGAINSITKQASIDYDYNKVTAGVGTDSYHRVTIDSNRVLNETAAIRVNGLHAYQEVPNRRPADKDRQGLALSGMLQPNNHLDIIVDYYGLRSKDIPDLGAFFTSARGSIVRNPPVYAQTGDFLTSNIDTVTGRVKYRLDETTRLTNTLRYGMAANDYVVTGARYSTTSPGYTRSSHQGWQDVHYIANQTNLSLDRPLWGKKHQLNVGLEFTDHKVLNGIYSLNGLSRSNLQRGQWDQDWAVQATSASLLDTVDLDERWAVTGGLRYDYYRMSLATQSTTGTLASYAYTGALLNYHLGTTYKFRHDAMVYLNHATASDINGGESDVGTSAGYGGLVANGSRNRAKPEKINSVELGTKWNINDGKLLATAALFHITKSDVLEGSGNGYTPTGTYNTGKNQVYGIEFGLSGNLTDKLSAAGGIALMNSDVLESAANASAEGKTLSNFANTSGVLQLKYQQTQDVAYGGAVRYEGKKYAGQPDTAAAFTSAGYSYTLPAYTVFDLFANYRINKKTSLRLNVANLFNNEYYLAGYRSGTFVYMGAARNARLTLNHEF